MSSHHLVFVDFGPLNVSCVCVMVLESPKIFLELFILSIIVVNLKDTYWSRSTNTPLCTASNYTASGVQVTLGERH